VERKKHSISSPQDRQRIVECANRGGSWKRLAETLGIKYKTAYGWVRSGEPQEKRRGGNKPRSLSEEEVNAIIGWIEEDCEMTLVQIKEKVRAEMNKSIATSTIGNYLEGRYFTVKKMHSIPETMNSIFNKERRREYLMTINQFIRNGKDVVWMDETNFNLFCRRTLGRSRAGTRAVKSLPASRGPNVHVIGAMSCDGIVKMTIRRGSFRNQDCNSWIQELLVSWGNSGKNTNNLVIVCDNAPCHSRLSQAVAESGALILHLGPYSPMLNPIETIWSSLKADVKSNVRVPIVQGPQVGEQRLQYLEGILVQAIGRISNQFCTRSYQHTTTFQAAIMAMENVHVGV
jgi:transposase